MQAPPQMAIIVFTMERRRSPHKEASLRHGVFEANLEGILAGRRTHLTRPKDERVGSVVHVWCHIVRVLTLGLPLAVQFVFCFEFEQSGPSTK